MPRLFLIHSIENKQVTMSPIFQKGDIPSMNTTPKVVSIDRVIGGRAKDASIPMAMPENRLADRIKILYPTHINSLKIFCKNCMYLLRHSVIVRQITTIQALH